MHDIHGHWAESSIRRVAGLDVLRGYPDGSFKPDNPVTRAETATLIDRMLMGWHDLINKVEAALVTVLSPWGRGSGTHIGGGLILTNYHVVAHKSGNDEWETALEYYFWNSSSHPRHALPAMAQAKAKLVAGSPQHDLAVLERTNYLNIELPAVPLCSPEFIRTGEEVIAVGSPYGLDRTVTRGIISHPSRRISYWEDVPDMKAVLLQMDAPINPGNSGGALINRAGHLIGVPSAGRVGADGLGFAIRIDSVLEFLEACGIPVEEGHSHG